MTILSIENNTFSGRDDFWDVHDELFQSTTENYDNISNIEFQLYLEESPTNHNENAILYWKKRPQTAVSKMVLNYLTRWY